MKVRSDICGMVFSIHTGVLGGERYEGAVEMVVLGIQEVLVLGWVVENEFLALYMVRVETHVDGKTGICCWS